MLRDITKMLALAFVVAALSCPLSLRADEVEEVTETPAPISAEQGPRDATNVLSGDVDGDDEEEKISSEDHVFSFDDDEQDEFE